LIFANVYFINTLQIQIINIFYVVTIISLLLYIGAVGKSAQIILQTWLPHAMEGPTPVSALIHAATMVTAGVYLIIKCALFFEQSKYVLLGITISGVITAIYSAVNGAALVDFKRVIAYSTCSQLGYMVFTCGFSAYKLSLFHLMNHAFFKAALFLGAGAVIHSNMNEQDIRKFGTLLKLLPVTFQAIFIASLAITGFPFLTGYFSKDLILEIVGGILESYTLIVY
jgi:NADH:ubiquinone oxidoreductase subunit 5 (subunit L)/multisubunit Na+/H+ antiporter MnhA subunit